ncbi:MAG: SGNH/GDSL hydrolase family protein [Gammaproteobacteria bacterium]|nr:SGNH/GDSL hydrolase family protein [Gammaproteobacteria bacterium]
MRRQVGTALVGILSVACLAFAGWAKAGIVSEVHVFGDSLSDNGNLRAATAGLLPAPFEIPPDPPYVNGRRSNGPVWTDYVEALVPATTLTNAAVAGAISGVFVHPALGSIDNLNDIAIADIFQTVTGTPQKLPDVIGLREQVTRFAGPSDPNNAVHVVWIGANDFFSGVRTPGDIIADVAGAIADLTAKGAMHFVVPNLPDLGLTPLAAALNVSAPGTQATLSAGSVGFNGALVPQMATLAGALGVSIEVVDIFTAFNELLVSAAASGIDTANPCIPVLPGSTVPIVPTAPNCGDPNGFIFYDAIHPTTFVHERIANTILPALNVVPEPSALALLGFGGLILVLRVGARRKG